VAGPIGAARENLHWNEASALVVAWAVEGDLDPADAVSNMFEMEWPPRSGRTQAFPEVDRVAWFDLHDARATIRAAQAPFLDRLERTLSGI
jgi:predicted NUDIX family NTP pyrophosphohydrolase